MRIPHRPFFLRIIAGMVVFVMVLCWGPFPVRATYTLQETPTEKVGFNSTIKDFAQYGDAIYVGGSFTTAGTPSVKYSFLDSSGTADVGLLPASGGGARVFVPDGSGGWYIAGAFTAIGLTTRNRIAHINADNTLDATFDPDVNSTVYALALSSDGSTLYAGGLFTTVNDGTPSYTRLAAFNTTDGSVIAAFDTDIADGYVLTLELTADESVIYAGGSFTTVNTSTTRNRAAAFTTADGTATAFDPNISSGGSNVWGITLDSTETIAYVAGSFTQVGSGTTRNRVAAFTIADSATTSFDPNASGEVNSMVLTADDDTLYLGGRFSTINGGTTRRYIAAVASASGTATAFDPYLNNFANSIRLSADESTLYAGGNFTTVNDGVAQSYFAAFDSSTGTVSTPDINVNGSLDGIGIGPSDDIAVGGSSLSLINQVSRPRIAAFSLSTGTLLPFSPGASSTVNTLAISSDGGTLYAGGAFTVVNGGTTRNRIAAFNTTTGTATSFDPNASGEVKTFQLTSGGGTLYAGGAFTTVNGATTRNRLAAFSSSTGTATSFNPNVGNGEVSDLKLSSDESSLFAGGAFTTVNGATTRNRVVEFSTTTGTATAFDPDIDSTVSRIEVTSDDSEVYAFGLYTSINGGAITQYYASSFTTAEGVATSFDPGFTFGFPFKLPYSALLTSDDAILYIGGNFDAVENGATARNRIAAYERSSDTFTAFNPPITTADEQVDALHISTAGTTLIAGGSFLSAGDSGAGNVALFTIDAPATPTPSPTPTPTTGAVPLGPWLSPVTPTGSTSPAAHGLTEGDTISSPDSNDPDVYIVNEHGFKRLFLNPAIFDFYGHLGGWSSVKGVSSYIRDTFITSGLFRNCETDDQEVYAVEVTGEDTGTLHHVNLSGEEAVAQDLNFFRKVFCINSNEFSWYFQGDPFTSLSQVPVYVRE